MYTDNCRYLSCFMFIGQFKSAKAFNWLAMQHARTNVRFLWNFFESGHGKGEHDGAGACIKRALRQHELAGTNICIFYVHMFNTLVAYILNFIYTCILYVHDRE